MNYAPGLPLGPLRLDIDDVRALARLLATRGGLVLVGVRVFDRYDTHIYDRLGIDTRLAAQFVRDLGFEFHGCRLMTADRSVTVVLEPERASLIAHSRDPLGAAVVALVQQRRDRRIALTSPAVLRGAGVFAVGVALLVLVLRLGPVLSPTVATAGQILSAVLYMVGLNRVTSSLPFSGARIR